MGFHNLLDADQVAAFYDERTKKLMLSTKGTVMEMTDQIALNRESWLGGLKFALEGFTGPLTGQKKQYEITNTFGIMLPNRATPTNTVGFVTAAHPNGVFIEIRFGIIEPPGMTWRAAGLVKQFQPDWQPLVARSTPATQSNEPTIPPTGVHDASQSGLAVQTDASQITVSVQEHIANSK